MDDQGRTRRNRCWPVLIGSLAQAKGLELPPSLRPLDDLRDGKFAMSAGNPFQLRAKRVIGSESAQIHGKG